MEEEDETPMRVDVRVIYFITCESCGLHCKFTEISGDDARRIARNVLWARKNGKTLCGECRGMGK